MNMRVDDIANRLWRHRADRGKQARSFARAAAGIDDRNRIVADDEAEHWRHHPDWPRSSFRCCRCEHRRRARLRRSVSGVERLLRSARGRRRGKSRDQAVQGRCPRRRNAHSHMQENGHANPARAASTIANFCTSFPSGADCKLVSRIDRMHCDCEVPRYVAVRRVPNHNLLLRKELPKLFSLLAS